MIYIIGTGPGADEHMSIKAIEAINKADVIVGYKTYVNLIKNLIKDKEVCSLGMRKEVDRCMFALENALNGKVVGLVSGGDCGVYGMAGIMYEIAKPYLGKVKIEVVPGITSANAAAASLGAPLMHDYVTISLSDLLTDWQLIEKRMKYACKGDFVITIYNPKSHGRVEHINKIRDILLEYKDKNTPVGIVRNAKRDNEEVEITTIDEMLNHEINMSTMVIVGNSKTYICHKKMITPRGYNY
ncbi:precorrin-3B C(17)-methyltransferase [Clostridiaceae bacterium M8S5]|nr:precorrin-3B C(17)-methyltransferase [Clostridiaceae bacterium M8S5]